MGRSTKARVFYCMLALVGLALMAACNRTPVERITVDELKDMMGRPDVTIIDVRLSADSSDDKQVIKGAVRESPNVVTRWMGKYPKDRTYVFYCA